MNNSINWIHIASLKPKKDYNMFLLLSLLLASCSGAEPDMGVSVTVPPTGYGEQSYGPGAHPGDQNAYANQVSQNVNEIFKDAPQHPIYFQTQKTNEIIDDLNKKSEYWKAENKASINKIAEASRIPRHKHTFDREQLMTRKRLENRIDLSKIDDLPLDYEFVSSEKPELERLYKDIAKAEAPYEQQKVFKQLGLEAVKNADQSYAEGDQDQGKLFQHGAECLLDLLLGIDPASSLGRSFYELYTGKNIVTGIELSSVDRGLAAATIMSLGTAGTGTRLIKIGSVLKHSFFHFEKTKHAIMSAGNFLQKKYWKLTGHGTKLKPHKFMSQDGKILDERMYEMPEYFIPWEK